jgi:hypothetical protein
MTNIHEEIQSPLSVRIARQKPRSARSGEILGWRQAMNACLGQRVDMWLETARGVLVVHLGTQRKLISTDRACTLLRCGSNRECQPCVQRGGV